MGVGGEGHRWVGDLSEAHVLTTLVRVIDDSGETGIGATATYTERDFDLSVLAALGPLVAGVMQRDSADVDGLADEARRAPVPGASGAHSVLDIALWDLVATHAGVPLCRVLGAPVDGLAAYASTSFLGSIEAYVRVVEDLRAAGFRGVKFHGWGEADRDVALIEAVSRAHGDAGVAFMLDAEQRYDRRDAARVARTLEDRGWHWFEAPLDDHDVDGYRELRRRTAVPVLCSGNWLWRPAQVREAAKAGAWDALRFDVTVAGGITAGRVLVALTEARSLPVELQSWGHPLIQAANLHLALASGRSNWFEMTVPHEPGETVVGDPIRPDAEGFVHAPLGPGLGVELDWEHIAYIALSSRSWTAKRGEKRPSVALRGVSPVNVNGCDTGKER